MSGSTTAGRVAVSRALSGSRKRRRSDQRWEVTEADLNMYGMIVGRTPSDAEKVEAIQRSREQAERREAEEPDLRAPGASWSPVVLCGYLHGLCVGTVRLNVGGPQFSGWVRHLSAQARVRLQQTQARLAGPRAR